MAQAQFRTRAFCVTSFDCSEEFLTFIKDLDYKYLIIGDELCPKTKKPHLQIYIYFSNARTLTSAIKIFKPHHVELSKGSPADNKKYCSKESLLFEDGVLPTKGKRTDIEQCRDIAKTTSCLRQVVLNCASFQGLRIAEKYLEYFEIPRNWKPQVQWFYGPSGSGKTKAAYEFFTTENTILNSPIYTCMDNIKWFQGYDGQPDVIIDDFRESFGAFERFIKLIDRYPYRVEMKGGSRQFLAKRIIVTSIYPPDEVYKHNNEPVKQLLRRIDKIVKFETPQEDLHQFSDSDSE